MGKYVSKVKDRTRIGNGTKQLFIESADSSKGLPNNDQFTLDRRSHAIDKLFCSLGFASVKKDVEALGNL